MPLSRLTTLHCDVKIGIKGKKFCRWRPFSYNLSGSRFEVAITISPRLRIMLALLKNIQWNLDKGQNVIQTGLSKSI